MGGVSNLTLAAIRSVFKHSCRVPTDMGLLDPNSQCGIPDWYYSDEPKAMRHCEQCPVRERRASEVGAVFRTAVRARKCLPYWWPSYLNETLSLVR
jgi:hypothetical protein